RGKGGVLQRAPLLFCRGLRIHRPKDRSAITFEHGRDLSLRGERKHRCTLRSHGPKIRLLLAQPVEEQRCPGLLSQLAKVQLRTCKRAAADWHAQSLGERTSSTLV